MDQVLRHLESDEAPADDHRAHRRTHHLESRVLPHPGEEARAPLDPPSDLRCVRHGPNREDSRKIDARQGRSNRGGARGQHQFVVGLGGHLVGGHVSAGSRRGTLTRTNEEMGHRTNVNRQSSTEAPWRSRSVQPSATPSTSRTVVLAGARSVRPGLWDRWDRDAPRHEGCAAFGSVAPTAACGDDLHVGGRRRCREVPNRTVEDCEPRRRSLFRERDPERYRRGRCPRLAPDSPTVKPYNMNPRG